MVNFALYNEPEIEVVGLADVVILVLDVYKLNPEGNDGLIVAVITYKVDELANEEPPYAATGANDIGTPVDCVITSVGPVPNNRVVVIFGTVGGLVPPPVIPIPVCPRVTLVVLNTCALTVPAIRYACCI